MKRNIDLTEDMMFSRNNMPLRSAMRQSMKDFGWRFRFNWQFEDWLSSENESIIPQKEQIIPLGNRETRMFIAECKEADSPYYCDCCGAYLLSKPWQIDGFYTLCSRCYNQIEKKHGDKMPWRMRAEREDARRRIFV